MEKIMQAPGKANHDFVRNQKFLKSQNKENVSLRCVIVVFPDHTHLIFYEGPYHN